ncbi:hypothetical protein AHX05_05175 [Salmonella enterica subsp. indica]|uniref:Uncharacterized protein n=1 Tax=Salmonella enterica TaxID=28901 RepID=A0A701ZFJ4_SALER|nr:hypothetical protein [Salmonella enterica subsp. indica]ECC3877130.1 hypothetical protein [Salmonella enterica subsp. indica]ECG1333050.1 hypothetical protein [Salmonella enterica subsp. indica]HAC6564321.1 hypothetical protein [Salmonella enterica subsp. indica]HAC6576019.1 hypothetical protein [Salmonella enterica subsp. indica]
MLGDLSPSFFKLQARWLRAFTPVAYSCKLLVVLSLAACLQLELFRVYTLGFSGCKTVASSRPPVA